MGYAKDRFAAARAQGKRSGLEVKITRELDAAGVPYQYEMFKLTYVIPERRTTYMPDLVLPNGIIIELKGQWETKDRKKHKLIKEQYPDLDIRIVFSNSKSKIGKRSKTTYGDYCNGLGIRYADKAIPQEWLDEPLTETRRASLAKHLKWEPTEHADQSTRPKDRKAPKPD